MKVACLISGADCACDVVDQATADADLQPLEILQRIHWPLGVEDLSRAMREDADHVQAFVLVEFPELAIVDAPERHGDRFRGVSEERKFADVGADETSGRIAVGGEADIGEPVAHGVVGLRRGDDRFRQQIAFHAALGCILHVLAERHGDVGRQQVRRRHPGVHIQDDLGVRGREIINEQARNRAERELRQSHANLPRI